MEDAFIDEYRPEKLHRYKTAAHEYIADNDDRIIQCVVKPPAHPLSHLSRICLLVCFDRAGLKLRQNKTLLNRAADRLREHEHGRLLLRGVSHVARLFV
jgi:hypothetical protein